MKKLNKFFAVLVALAMMAMLCVSTAFAEQTAALEEELANARIKKTFTIPEGVVDPDITVQFDFTQNKAESKGLKANEDLPTLASPEVTYNGDGQLTTEDKSGTEFAALPTTTFPHAGVYAYDVIEGAYTVTTTDENENEVQKGGEQYIVRYYVKTDDQGNTYVDYITVQEKVTEGKVDSFIDKQIPGETGYDEWTDGDDSNFLFTNVYTVKDGTEDPTPDNPVINPTNAALKVSKAVTGLAQGATDSTRFPFTITITPAAGQENTELKAWIIDASTGAVVNNAATPDVTIIGADTSDTFYLTNGQALAFANAPAGTRYTVSENLANATEFNDYTPSYAVTSQGSAGGPSFSGQESAGKTLTTAGETDGSTYLLAADKNDAVAYTNEKLDTTPTGILINNLPYIALALVAIGGLVAYVVVRRRDENA